MNQAEVDEFSTSFLEAWIEYFGTEMYIIPYAYTASTNIYGDVKKKKYDLDNAILVHGTLKETEAQDMVKPDGKYEIKYFDITLISKELYDQGVQYIDTNSIIKYIDRFNNEYYFKIYDTLQKVQFSNNKIFTKLKVTQVEWYPA